MVNYYDILEINKNASEEEIKKSYKKLAMKYHPDKNSEGETKFKEITEAYDTLKDTRKRMIYNASLNRPTMSDFSQDFYRSGFPQGTTFYATDGINLSDILKMFASAKRTYDSYNIPVVSIETFVTLAEVIQGCTKKINIHYTDSNRVNKTNLKSIDIPVGVQEGEKIVLKKEGNYSSNSSIPRGDVHIIIKYKKDTKFVVKNKDLHCDMKISFKDSILLPLINLTTATGEKITIKLDKTIKDKSVTTILGQGLPTLSGKRGDMIIHFSVEYPEFTQKQKKLIEIYF